MADLPMTRVAILGAGNIGAVQAAAFKSLGIELAAMVDTDPAREEVARRFGAAFFPDAAAMLRQVRPDVVSICTPTDGHRALTELAVAHKAHVIVEKPMARTSADGAAMSEACRRAGLHLLPGHVTRFYPEYQAVRTSIQDGAVGPVQHVHTFRQADRPPGEWMADPDRSGGVILDLMIHDFDWVQWAIGPVADVFCRATPALDQAHALLRLTSGATVLAEGSWLHPGGFSAGLSVTGERERLTMACRGSASALQLHRRGRPAVMESPLALSPHARELAHFLAVVRGEAEPAVTPADGIAAIRVAEAAIASARTGRPVPVEGVSPC